MTRASIRCGVAAFLLLAASVRAEEELSPTQQLWVNSFDAEKGGRYDKAREYMETIVREGGDFYFANLRLGWLHYVAGDYAAGVASYRKAAGLAPGAIPPLIGLISCYASQGNNADAVKAAKALLEIDPLNYTGNKSLGDQLYAAGDYAGAGAYYEKLCGLYPEDLTIANALAWSCLNRGMTQEAARIFNNILTVNPNMAVSRQGLDLCLGPAPVAKEH